MVDTWLSEANEGLLFAVFFVLLLLTAEAGFRLARHARLENGQVSSQASAIQGAVLGLLALLLGFTFSLAVSRFEARKEIWRDEANAIGTTYLRAQLLPEPMSTRVQTLLRSYVETRFELAAFGHDAARVRAVHARSSALQTEMWNQVLAVARGREVDAEIVTLFAASLNQTIDLHNTRLAAIRNHVPAAIFLLLFLVAAASLGLTGYVSGPNHRQSFVLNTLVAALITLVTLLTFDLHRPTRGFITLKTTVLDELRDSVR